VLLLHFSDDISRGTSYWRDWVTVYLMYLTVGTAAVPAGIVYGILSANGYARWWTAAICLAVGFVAGAWTWRHVSRHLHQARHRRPQRLGTLMWSGQETSFLYIHHASVSISERPRGANGNVLQDVSRESVGTMHVVAQ
jgi:membrane protein DedA with SNARE-associated domain